MALFRRSQPTQPGGADDVVATPPPTTPSSTGPAPSAGARRDPPDRADLARLDRIRQGLAAFGADTSTPEAVGELLDRISAEWVATPPKRRPDPGASVNNIGVGLGDHLCERLGGRWIVYTDESGSELAVEVGDGGPVLFPLATVGRWWGEKSGWVPQYMAEAAAEARRAAEQGQAATGAHRTPSPPHDTTPAAAEGPAPASPQVNRLAKRALDRAVSFVLPGGGPVMPFALVEDAQGGVDVAQFGGSAAESQDSARRHVRASSGVRAAVAWDGAIREGGATVQALLVEACDRGQSSLLVAQRHQDGRLVGPPMMVGRQAPLL